MFLTKKSLWKIIILPTLYFLLGTACIVLDIICWILGLTTPILLLGILMYLLTPLVALWVIYAQGKAKLQSAGMKLIYRELKPAEFIARYNQIQASPDLIVNKPSFEVLQLLVIAYEAVGDRERVLALCDQRIALASKKKKPLAILAKASYLYIYGDVAQAEELFAAARSQKQDVMCQTLTDAILKSDRAMALGDYATVEAYTQQMLARKFPKHEPLTLLLLHLQLAEVYEKTQRIEQAIEHYRFCAQNGGETVFQRNAQAALARLEQA